MKKMKLFASTAMMMLVATAGYFGYTAYKYANMTDAERMMQANLEALTRGEPGGSGCGFAAYEYDNDLYEDTKNFRRCGDCQWVSGTKPQYTNC